MDILGFIRGMLPSFGKKDVEEKLRMASSKIAKIVRPCLDLFADGLNELQFKSAYGKLFMKELVEFLPNHLRHGTSPFVTVMTTAVANAEKLVELLEQYVTKNMGEGIHIEGITYQKATVLRLIELLDFFADYTSRHLSMLVAAETNIEAFDREDGNPFTPAELRWLESNRGAYLQFIEILHEDPKNILKKVNEIPEIVMGDAETASVPALAGGAADPLLLGAIPLISYSFRWIGIRNVNWDIERYERCLKEKQSIELRLESLRQRKAGSQDALNESIIGGYENELVLLRGKIAALEEKSR